MCSTHFSRKANKTLHSENAACIMLMHEWQGYELGGCAEYARKEHIMGRPCLSVHLSLCPHNSTRGTTGQIRIILGISLCHWALPQSRTFEFSSIGNNKMADEETCKVGPTLATFVYRSYTGCLVTTIIASFLYHGHHGYTGCIGYYCCNCLLSAWFENHWMDRHKIRYGGFAIGDYLKTINLNFLWSVIGKWRTRKLMRWDRHNYNRIRQNYSYEI